MLLKQISVFLENKKGSLLDVTKTLGDLKIDLIALSIADTTDFGIMRCIVNSPEEALKALQDNGFTASTTEVMAVEVPDEPGGLASVLQLMYDNDINVEYLYSFVRTKNDNALILFRVENTDACLALFKEHNVTMLSSEQVYSLHR